jgi:hypothetical protein
MSHVMYTGSINTFIWIQLTQHCVINLVSKFWQFMRFSPVSSTCKIYCTCDITEILLKVALNTYCSNPTESTCKLLVIIRNKGRCGRNRVVVGFTTTCAISVYHWKTQTCPKSLSVTDKLDYLMLYRIQLSMSGFRTYN